MGFAQLGGLCFVAGREGCLELAASCCLGGRLGAGGAGQIVSRGCEFVDEFVYGRVGVRLHIVRTRGLEASWVAGAVGIAAGVGRLDVGRDRQVHDHGLVADCSHLMNLVSEGDAELARA